VCGEPEAPSATLMPDSLEILGRELAQALREEGHHQLQSVPEARLPDERRHRAWRAVRAGQPQLEPAVADQMAALPFPRYFLRFDTIGFATPIWSGTRPYQILPFQWTCDIEQTPGHVQHRHFLATHGSDPRRAFALTLLLALGERGTIFAYNAGFEINRIRELAVLLEDHAAALLALIPRIVDLFHVARGHYYHPEMAGSWSFKSISRAVAPDVQADVFEWRGLDTPQAAFAACAFEAPGGQVQQSCQAALLAHGRQETAVLRRMVALFEQA
jgi:hypothetical protein